MTINSVDELSAQEQRDPIGRFGPSTTQDRSENRECVMLKIAIREMEERQGRLRESRRMEPPLFPFEHRFTRLRFCINDSRHARASQGSIKGRRIDRTTTLHMRRYILRDSLSHVRVARQS
jgi:hypothetical protein